MITLQNMVDIKAAVQGKTVRTDGTVDHQSVALTPHLTLGIAWYDFELLGQYQWLKKDGLLDLIGAVSPWIWQQEDTTAADERNLLATLRTYVPEIPIYPGVYLTNSAMHWGVKPSTFATMITETIEMYDTGANHPGTLIFAGEDFERGPEMNATRWKSYDLPAVLTRVYYPYVGSADIAVVDLKGTPVAGAELVVHYGNQNNTSTHTFVTRKITDFNGHAGFGGWTGRAALLPHTVEVTAADGTTLIKEVQLMAATTLNITITLNAMTDPTVPKVNEPTKNSMKTDDGDDLGFMAAPFYSDPLFDAAHDAEFVWHAGEQTWWITYLQNRYNVPLSDPDDCGGCFCESPHAPTPSFL